MNGKESTAEVLIVGSGPTGLTLALSLRRNGIAVRVIEKSTEYRLGSRGAGIHPRSLELFESLGICDEVVALALDIPPMRHYKMPEGTEVLKDICIQPWEEPTPAIPYNNSVLLGQDSLDKIMRAELAKLGCEVELGVELQTFTQFDDHVSVTLLKHGKEADSDPITETARYAFVVGADGARGTVRHTLGLKLVGETTQQEMIVGDVEMEDGLDLQKWHIWGDMTSTFASLRALEVKGVFNFIIGGTFDKTIEETCSDKGSIINILKKLTGNRTDLNFRNVLWVSPYRINIRMTETFRIGRVLLAGDAAHIHSPTGGQGMNTGVQDAFNLGWKLALVLKGSASQSLLDTYNAERLPVVSSMLNITTQILKKTMANNDSAWERSGQLKQLGVNYRWSPIVVDEGREAKANGSDELSTYKAGEDGSLLAGDRAPDAPGLVSEDSKVTTRLFKIFDPSKHTVLLFSGKFDAHNDFSALKIYPSALIQIILINQPGESTHINDQAIAVFEDTEGHALRAYNPTGAPFGIFVIRPDGILGARVTGTEGLLRYFRQIFVDSV